MRFQRVLLAHNNLPAWARGEGSDWDLKLGIIPGIKAADMQSLWSHFLIKQGTPCREQIGAGGS